MTLRPKHQRLVLASLALAALVAAVLLAMWGLKDRAAYFATPSDIAAGKIAQIFNILVDNRLVEIKRKERCSLITRIFKC